MKKSSQKPIKRTALRAVSQKRQAQMKAEKELSKKMLDKCGGKCMKCGKLPDWRGLSKHEIIFRSQGGDPLDESNCQLLCGTCHDLIHGIIDK
jgi:5-methylcytosine-specific restriction endonuclease McrA